MFTFGVPLHGKSPYVKSLLLVEKKQDFVIRVTINSQKNKYFAIFICISKLEKFLYA